MDPLLHNPVSAVGCGGRVVGDTSDAPWPFTLTEKAFQLQFYFEIARHSPNLFNILLPCQHNSTVAAK